MRSITRVKRSEKMESPPKLSAREVAKLAVSKFERASDVLIEFVNNHDEIFDAFWNLVEDRNSYLTEAQIAVREVKSDRQVRMGSFSRAKDSANVAGFDPKFLPNRVLNMVGVVTKVDTKVINTLLEAEAITEADVSQARTEVPGRSPSLRGPKAIVVEL